MRASALIVAVLALALAPAAARGDGDPASDVLLQQDVFLPYSTPTSQGAAGALIELTKRTRAAGWPVKVAVIASGDDLGSAAQFANDPQGYANFLGQELATPAQHQRLLVVTPVGFGGQNLGDNVNKALAGLNPTGNDGDALARLALTAVGRLAAADGHPVAVPAVDTSGANARPYRSDVSLHSGNRITTTARRPGARRAGGGGGGGTTALAIIGPIALVALAIGIVTLRQRRTA